MNIGTTNQKSSTMMKFYRNDSPKLMALAGQCSVAERSGVTNHFGNECASHTTANGNRRIRESSNGERSVSLSANIVARALETPALSNLLVTAAGSSSSLSRNFTEQAGQTMLLYCSRGRGWCEIRGQRHEISAGELMVVPPGISYDFGMDGERNCLVSWIRLTGANLQFFTHQLGFSIDRPVIEVGEEEQLTILFQEIFEIVEDGCTSAHLLQAARAVTRLFDVINSYARNQFMGEADAALKIRQSIAYMRQHLDQPLQVAALAAHVNVSQSHYFAIFKRLTGSTPIDYFIHLRMQQASHLLVTTSASVKEIAGVLGYDDPFYFSRVFRSVQGIAPSEYRLLSRGMEVPPDRRPAKDRLQFPIAVRASDYPATTARANEEDSP